MNIVQWCGVCRRHPAKYQVDFDAPLATMYMCEECHTKLEESS